MGIDCTGSCNSSYFAIMTTTPLPVNGIPNPLLILNGSSIWCRYKQCKNTTCTDSLPPRYPSCCSLFIIRDQPFNLKGGYGFLFHSEFFFRTTRELEYLFILSRKARIFFPEFNIRLYDKNSESDYFFFLSTKIRIFFSATLEIRNFF